MKFYSSEPRRNETKQLTSAQDGGVILLILNQLQIIVFVKRL